MANMPTKHRKSTEELVGVWAFTVYLTDDGFVVGRLANGTGVRGNVTGDESLEIGRIYRFFGMWKDHPKHGRQFDFTSFVPDYAHSRTGVVRYLIDEAKGVGTNTASRLWDAYGEKAVDVLRDNPERVVKDRILRPEDAKISSDHLRRIKALQETTIDLNTIFDRRGFPRKLIKELIFKYGATAPDIIRADAYRLITDKFWGCGFKRVDRLFLDMGGKPDDPRRQIMCAWHAIKSDMSGNTWLHVNKAWNHLADNIGGARVDPPAAIRGALEKGMLSLWNPASKVEDRKGWLAETAKAEDERLVAKHVHRLMSGESKWPELKPEDFGDEHQCAIVKKATSSPLAILTGTPGTGKTYCVSIIIKVLMQAGIPSSMIGVCAPTGKAAVRCTEAMNKNGIRKDAVTIHRLLAVGPSEDGSEWGFQFREDNPLPYLVVVVDEVSMLGTSLAARLLSACGQGTHVLLVGDKYQLPPVEHGAPLRDLLQWVPSQGELTKIRRNSGRIVKACAQLKEFGRFDVSPSFNPGTGENLGMVLSARAEDSIRSMKKLIDDFSGDGFNPRTDIQVLCAVNAKSELSRKRLNSELQEFLNQDGMKVDGNPFRLNDKVICLKNGLLMRMAPKSASGSSNPDDYRVVKEADEDDLGTKPAYDYVANGDIGYVVALNKSCLIVRFVFPPRLVRLHVNQPKENDEDGESEAEPLFDLAYAITTHKSQGSEWPVVICMIDDYPGANFVCSREWHYTALSRASKVCVLIGQKRTIIRHAAKISISDRKTFLVELLKGEGHVDQGKASGGGKGGKGVPGWRGNGKLLDVPKRRQ